MSLRAQRSNLVPIKAQLAEIAAPRFARLAMTGT
jgi:hypothetical protein